MAIEVEKSGLAGELINSDNNKITGINACTNINVVSSSCHTVIFTQRRSHRCSMMNLHVFL